MKEMFNKLIEELKTNLKEHPNIKNQIPNLLTLSRGIAPTIIIPLVLTGNITPALIAAGIFASTDFVDGYLARKYNNVSKFGEHLDQICDKIFSITLLLTSAVLNPIILLNILPEFAIAAINLNSLKKGNNPKTSSMGKIKTGILSSTIVMSLIPGINIATPLLSLLTLFTQVVTAVDYYNIDKVKDQEKENSTIENAEAKQTLAEPSTKTIQKSKAITGKTYKITQNTRQQIIELLKLKRDLIAPEKGIRKKLVLPTQKDK